MVGGDLHAGAPGASLTRADPSAVLPLIETIEKLPRSATGAFVFGPPGSPDGAVFVEKGRICWAASEGMPHRLAGILRARLDPSAAPSALDDIVRRCLADAEPFGEALVASGMLSSDGLREALRQHTSEAILLLGQRADETPTWIAHRRQRYNARFTFSPAEILAGVGASCLPDRARHARVDLEALVRRDGSAIAFAWVGISAALFPICEVQGSQFSVEETINFGSWAARVLQTPLMLRAVPALAAMTGARGDSLVAWLTGGVVYVVICSNPSSLAHVLGKRARASPDDRSGS